MSVRKSSERSSTVGGLAFGSLLGFGARGSAATTARRGRRGLLDDGRSGLDGLRRAYLPLRFLGPGEALRGSTVLAKILTLPTALPIVLPITARAHFTATIVAAIVAIVPTVIARTIVALLS